MASPPAAPSFGPWGGQASGADKNTSADEKVAAEVAKLLNERELAQPGKPSLLFPDRGEGLAVLKVVFDQLTEKHPEKSFFSQL